jgi:hypothetical protein
VHLVQPVEQPAVRGVGDEREFDPATSTKRFTVSISEYAHWHPRRSREPAGVWLCELLHDVAVQLEDDGG